MAAHLKINYVLAAAMVASGASLEEIATKVGAKNANCLRVALQRRNITKRNYQSFQVAKSNLASPSDRAQAKGLQRASNELRETFSGILANHASALGNVPARANLKYLRAVGEAIEPLARTAKIVHGWDAQDKAGLLLEMCDAGAIIELEPANPACGIEATTGSVQPAAAIADKPQETQASDSQDNAS